MKQKITDILVIGLQKITDIKDDKELYEELKDAKKREAYKEEKLNTYLYSNKKSEYKKILIINTGKKEEFDEETARKVTAIATKTAQTLKYQDFTLELKNIDITPNITRAIYESHQMTNYFFEKYTQKKATKPQINILQKVDLNQKQIGQKIGKAINYVRDLVNDTSQQINPDTLEQEAKRLAKQKKCKITIIKGKALQKKGLNLIYNVGKASQFEPRLIIIQKPGKNNLNIVGKGVTYDTGGYNIKQTGFMEDMKMDMGGAATALGILSISEIFKDQGLTITLPLVENCINGSAYKPGDIIKSYSGKTIEVLNTDAEGRLILADAISYSEKNYETQKTITIATLTGAIIIALGEKYTGLFSNNQEFANKLLEASKKSHDLAWQLPLQEFENDMDGDISDLKNIANVRSRSAGSIQAATFLSKFTQKPWTHFDIAGSSYYSKEEYYNKKYATGRNLRLLAYYLLND